MQAFTPSRADTAATRFTLEHLPAPAAVIDEQAIVREINPAARAVFGRSHAESSAVVGRPLAELLARPDAPLGICRLVRAMEAQASAEIALPPEGARGGLRLCGQKCAPGRYLILIRTEADAGESPPALPHSDEPLQALLDASRVAAVLFDDAGRYLRVNDAACRVLGRPREGLLGRSLLEILRTPPARPTMAEEFAAYKQKRRWSGPLTLLRPDGAERVVEYTALQAAPNLHLAIFVDVTDHVRAEEALRRSEMRWRHVLDRAADGIAISDESGRSLYVNDAYCTLVRRPKEEIVGAVQGQFVPESERGAWRLSRRLLRENGESRRRGHVEHGDGRLLSIEAHNVDLGDGTYLSIVRDMTAWAEMQQRLRQSEKRYRSVVEFGTRGIVIVNADGGIAFHNRRGARLLGESEPLVGRSLASLVAEPDRSLLAAALQATREGGATRPGAADGAVPRSLSGGSPPSGEESSRSIEIRLPASARGERLVRLTLTRYSGDGAALGELEDISQQRALEAQMRQRQRMELVGQLAAGVSHDLKNLLTVVLGNLDLAAMDAAGGVRDSIERAAEAARSGSCLAKQLLAIGHAAGAPRAPILLAPTVVKALALLRSTSPGAIEFVSDIPDDLRVVANASQLEQAFLNLALNARHAMPHGGRLRVRAHGIHALPDSVTLPSRPGGYVEIDVEDSGCGMTPEVAARMFEPFFTTKGNGGSGLGGAVVYGIVSEHQGAITVATAPGAGTTVSLYLPAAPPSARTEADPGGPP